MIEQTVEVRNPTGLHGRPLALFVQTAGEFTSNIWIAKGEKWIAEGAKKVNAKSIMGLMSLAVSQGTSVIIGAEGEDEQLAVNELCNLIASRFGE